MFARIAWQVTSNDFNSASSRYYSSRRVVKDYDKNITNSIGVQNGQLATRLPPLTSDRKADILANVHENARLIQEHAARRSDLFFYQMVAFHRINEKYHAPVMIEKVKTCLQYGSGSLSMMNHACHSALFPEVKMYTTSLAGKKVIAECGWENTFLNHSMNATVLLPVAVNGVDGYMEGRRQPSACMSECLVVLNKVANGVIDPAIGMSHYYRSMYSLFSTSSTDYLNRSDKYTSSEIKRAILECLRPGIFHGASNQLTMLDEYLYLLLRLNTHEINHIKNDASAMSQYYQRMQDEIWQNKFSR